MNDLKFRYKKVAVLGVGIEGVALTDFLLGHSAEVTLCDRLGEEDLVEKYPGDKGEITLLLEGGDIKKRLGARYLDNLNDFDIVFRSPGISYYNPQIQAAKKAGVIISSQINLFFELSPARIIGVTGTKGKGTTALLIYEMLKKAGKSAYLAGNIGYPAISLLPKLNKDDLVVLELSSFQLSDLKKSPEIAVVTNLSEDHLDYHSDVFEYYQSKLNILRYQKKGDHVILNYDDENLRKYLPIAKAKKRYFSSHRKDYIAAAVVGVGESAKVILGPGKRNVEIASLNTIRLFGRHNLENIAAASIVADILGISEADIREAVREFRPLSHRLEFVREIKGVKFINDSYATNPEPTIAAINSFPNPEILILGGSSKGADFSRLAKVISNSKVKSVVLIGIESAAINKALLKASFYNIFKVGSLEAAVRKVKGCSEPGDIVLFSPACASFDMFRNYKERGEQFKSIIYGLADEPS